MATRALGPPKKRTERRLSARGPDHAYQRPPMKQCIYCGCLYDDAGCVCEDCTWQGKRDPVPAAEARR